MNILDMVRLFEGVEKIQRALDIHGGGKYCSGLYVFFYGEDLIATGLDGHTFFWQKIPYSEEFANEFDRDGGVLIDYFKLAECAKQLKAVKRNAAELVCMACASAQADGGCNINLKFSVSGKRECFAIPGTMIRGSDFESVKSLYRRLVCHHFTQGELVDKEFMIDTTGKTYVYPHDMVTIMEFFVRKLRRNDRNTPVNSTSWMLDFKDGRGSEAWYTAFCSEDSTHGCVTMNVRVG